MADMADKRISKLEYWRDGNGAKGAEERIQENEKLRLEKVGIKECSTYRDDVHGSIRDLRSEIKKVNGLNSLMTIGGVVAIIVSMIFLN